MQANNYVAFKHVASNNVQAILNPHGEVYMYLNPAQAGNGDCLVFRVYRSAKGFTLSWYGYAHGATLHTKTHEFKHIESAVCHMSTVVNKYA